MRIAPGRTLRNLALRFGGSRETVRNTLWREWETETVDTPQIA